MTSTHLVGRTVAPKAGAGFPARALVASLLLLGICTAAWAADRVALVIGNGHYQTLPKLEACPHDAQKMAEAFQKIGIRVYGGKPLFDLTTDQMDAALNDFAHSLGRDSEAFVYYSGHGAQIGGSNYLLPVGFDAKFESQARRQGVSLDDILALLEKTDSKLRVVIFDACRDAGEFLPGEPALKGLSHAKGLGEQKVDAPETLVCFATKHGTAALAGENGSPYTDVLAEEIVKPGEIDQVMRTVARRVYEATNKQQLPFTYGSLLQDHYFAGPPASAAAASTAPPEPPPGQIPGLPASATPPMTVARLTTPAPRAGPPESNPIQPNQTESNLSNPATAKKDAPFVNSLGMKFVPVPGAKVLFSIWDTRVQDYAAYAQAKGVTPAKPSFVQGPTHPVVNVSWESAQAFCQWLSKKEKRKYRLPTDAEWSLAVGLGLEQGSLPEEKRDSGPKDVYPWGRQWPPPNGAGNYGQSLNVDSYEYTSPVGSFSANRHGLYDMGGNVWQWCEDWSDAHYETRVGRGGSWYVNDEIRLRSSYRYIDHPASRNDENGFRCVLVVSGG